MSGDNLSASEAVWPQHYHPLPPPPPLPPPLPLPSVAVIERRSVDTIEVIYLSAIITIGTTLNLIVFTQLLRQPKIPTATTSFLTGPYYTSSFILFKINLSVTDFAILLLHALGKVIWLLTYDWKFGDTGCKMYQFLSAFTYYSNSNVVVAIGLDRLKVVYTSHIQGAASVRRVRLLLALAWILAAICALPQLFVWTSVELAPGFAQCTTVWQVRMHRNNAAINGNGMAVSSGPADTSDGAMEHNQLRYEMLHQAAVFWLPFITLVASYFLIMLKVLRYTLNFSGAKGNATPALLSSPPSLLISGAAKVPEMLNGGSMVLHRAESESASWPPPRTRPTMMSLRTSVRRKSAKLQAQLHRVGHRYLSSVRRSRSMSKNDKFPDEKYNSRRNRETLTRMDGIYGCSDAASAINRDADISTLPNIEIYQYRMNGSATKMLPDETILAGKRNSLQRQNESTEESNVRPKADISPLCLPDGNNDDDDSQPFHKKRFGYALRNASTCRRLKSMDRGHSTASTDYRRPSKFRLSTWMSLFDMPLFKLFSRKLMRDEEIKRFGTATEDVFISCANTAPLTSNGMGNISRSHSVRTAAVDDSPTTERTTVFPTRSTPSPRLHHHYTLRQLSAAGTFHRTSSDRCPHRSSASTVRTMRYRRQMSSQVWKRQLRSRVFVTSLAIVVAHCALWLPYNLLNSLRFINGDWYEWIVDNGGFLLEDLIILNSLVNPILYGYVADG